MMSEDRCPNCGSCQVATVTVINEIEQVTYEHCVKHECESISLNGTCLKQSDACRICELEDQLAEKIGILERCNKALDEPAEEHDHIPACIAIMREKLKDK